MRSLVDNFSLREINFAKTRLNILQVVKERILEKDFEEITVDEICRYAEISRGTFFNYFPTKSHIFKYYIRIWKIKLGLEIEEGCFTNKSVKEKIKCLYNQIAKEDKKSPGFFVNYLKHVIESKELDNEIKLTEAEFAYEFPDIHLDPKRIESLNELSLEEILKNILKEGIKTKEFKEDIDIDKTLLLLISIFFSPVIVYKFMNKPYKLEEYYEYSLNQLFENIAA